VERQLRAGWHRALCVLLHAGALPLFSRESAALRRATLTFPACTPQAIYIYRLDTFELETVIAGFEKTITAMCWCALAPCVPHRGAPSSRGLKR
jgi:hypothetical protein